MLGDLIISPSVKNSEVTLENIVVRGDIRVEGAARITLKNVTAITINADHPQTTEYILSGETSVYQMNVSGGVIIDEKEVSEGYLGIKRLVADSSETLKKVTLRFGTIEQTVKSDSKKK